VRRWRKLRRWAAAPAALLAASLARPASAEGFDVALWDALLGAYTREVADAAGVRVDYRGLAAEPRWRELLAGLAGAEVPGDRAGRLAFWINAYNVLAIDVVLQSYPLASIRDAGSLLRPVWKRPAGRAGGAPRTLDEIEHRILRPLGEPRIHAAIVCASSSCPSLRREAFRAERIEEQLEDSLRAFLAHPEKGSRYDAASHTLWLSPIFDWFAEDFAAGGGVLAVLRPRLPEGTRSPLAARPDAPRLRYFEYDWRLNDLSAAP
jgi:hypothetical protein